MNRNLIVQICENVEKSSLVLSADDNLRGRYVLLSHPTNSKITYSININGGHLLLGLNELQMLNSVELNIYKENWNLVNLDSYKPVGIGVGCAKFPNVDQRINELDVPLRVLTNQTYSAIFIQINAHKKSYSRWIAISGQSFVAVSDNYLMGFWINIHPH
jgi:hypothetical protein